MQENKAVQSKLNYAVSRILAVLLLLTFISCHVISGTIAKYITSSGVANDSARVASFSVSADNGDSSLTVRYPGAATYTVKVKNESEVAVKYKVEVQFNGDVTSVLSLKLGTMETTGVFSGGKTTYSFSSSAFELSPLNADGEKAMTLSIAPQSSVLPGSGNNLSEYSASYGFNVEVTFEQID